MLSSVEQAFVGRDEKRAPLKTPAWEATLRVDACFFKKGEKNLSFQKYPDTCGRASLYAASRVIVGL